MVAHGDLRVVIVVLLALFVPACHNASPVILFDRAIVDSIKIEQTDKPQLITMFGEPDSTFNPQLVEKKSVYHRYWPGNCSPTTEAWDYRHSHYTPPQGNPILRFGAEEGMTFEHLVLLFNVSGRVNCYVLVKDGKIVSTH
jgi:hypothetical protein